MLRSLRSVRTLPDSPAWLYAAPGQLRAPWRLICFGVSMFLLQGIAESILAPIFAGISRVVGEPIAAYPFIMLTGVFGAVAVSLRMVDDGEWSAVGLGDNAWRPGTISVGAALGAAAILLTTLALFATGALRFEASPHFDGALSSGDTWFASAVRAWLVLAPAALWEELVFRGYLWHVARDAAGVRVALWSTSAAFAATHLGNPGANVRTTVLVLLAGLCLGLLRERTSSLPAAWGAHLAWNWVMAALLHLDVSGLQFATPRYRGVLRGASWWSGGSWGPEGGVAAALVLAGALLAFEWPHKFPLLLPQRRAALGESIATTITRSQ